MRIDGSWLDLRHRIGVRRLWVVRRRSKLLIIGLFNWIFSNAGVSLTVSQAARILSCRWLLGATLTLHTSILVLVVVGRRAASVLIVDRSHTLC